MDYWKINTQLIVDEIDKCIQEHKTEDLTLDCLAKKLNFSKYHTTRKFKEISGMRLRDYLGQRKLAFAFKDLRDTNKEIIEIAFNAGFSSHEAFTRAFKTTFGITPSDYRKTPSPMILRTKINPIDCFFAEIAESESHVTHHAIKTYLITIPAHKFLHVANYESNGYWDFWQKQSLIPGQDCDTICGLLDSIKGKLDDLGGTTSNSSSGQIMAYINNPQGRLCDWNIRRVECYGVRLPLSYSGHIPPQMKIIEIPDANYIVFEHGPFDTITENRTVEAKIEEAMRTYDFSRTDYCIDDTDGRISYFYHDPERFWKYIRPLRKHAT